MKDIDVEKVRTDLMTSYSESRVFVAEDNREIIAEISPGFAVAVIERSLPHFHCNMTENYCVLRGTLYVVRGGRGFALRAEETISIESGKIHFARAANESVWIEVKSDPPWSADDHFVL